MPPTTQAPKPGFLLKYGRFGYWEGFKTMRGVLVLTIDYLVLINHYLVPTSDYLVVTIDYLEEARDSFFDHTSCGR